MVFASPEGFVSKPNSGTDFSLISNLKNGMNHFDFGDAVEINLSLTKNAYLMLLANTPDGKTVLLSPNGYNGESFYRAGDHSIYLGTAGIFPFNMEDLYDVQILSSTYPLSFFEDMKESFIGARQTYYTFNEQAKEMLIQSRMESSQEWIARTFSLTVSSSEGNLQFYSTPEGATVFVDGIEMGITPLFASLKPGIHELLLKKEHFKDLRTNIMITANQTLGKTFSMTPRWGNGEIMVDSFPQGAKIQVDGKDAGVTPNRVKMSFGMHVVSIFKDGYEFFSKLVIIDGDEQISRDINESLTPINSLSDPMTNLTVMIAQQEFEWKLDGIVQKNTTVKLNPGYHVLEVIKQGFERFVERIYIAPGQKKVLQINLLPLKGLLIVEVENTFATVFVNGEQMGKSPCSIALSEGNYQITLVAPGYKAEIKDVFVQPGMQTEIRLTMANAPNNF